MSLRKASASLVVVSVAAALIDCGGISQREGDDASGSGPNPGDASSATGSGATSGTTGSGTSGSGATSGTTGSGGSSDPGDGGAAAAGGIQGSGGMTYVDPNCYPPNATEGAACTQDCDVECGLAAMGTKHCTCFDGSYIKCSCPRPLEYLGAPTAPYCSTGNGMTPSIKGTACSTPWDQCIALDPVTGVTPRGCVCLPNELGGNLLMWFCGSTNRWFELAE